MGRMHELSESRWLNRFRSYWVTHRQAHRRNYSIYNIDVNIIFNGLGLKCYAGVKFGQNERTPLTETECGLNEVLCSKGILTFIGRKF